jgi:putative PIN family toxin of toxin-antitoxin system
VSGGKSSANGDYRYPRSNIYISALQFGGAGARLLSMARVGQMRLDISDAILDETIGVLRDKFGWDGYRLHFARLELQKIANRVTPMQTVDVVDDPDDNCIIECALTAGSDYIVTNDNALLRIGKYGDITIVRVSEYLERGRAR